MAILIYLIGGENKMRLPILFTVATLSLGVVGLTSFVQANEEVKAEKKEEKCNCSKKRCKKGDGKTCKCKHCSHDEKKEDKVAACADGEKGSCEAK
jgi:hypothetical protein